MLSFDIAMYTCRECAVKAKVKVTPYRTLGEFGFDTDAPMNCSKCGKPLIAAEGIFKAGN